MKKATATEIKQAIGVTKQDEIAALEAINIVLESELAQAKADLIQWDRFEEALRTLGEVDVDFFWEQHLDGRPKNG